ncbi:MAG: hypothetical protein K2M20_12340 [Lachnospiraceae bacterium]|nr:hypothetical protein [Lachnospiraceae bacterium]
MSDKQIKYRNGGIHQYDGYRSKPIWKQPENDSTYYNSELDTQCHVPSRSLKELQEERELELAGVQQ